MSTTNPQQFFIGRPNHKPTLIFARWVSNRGFLELALPDVGALGGHICGPHGDAACHILDSLICSKKKPFNRYAPGMSGWWFGRFFIFHFIYGMSSFPLTNIFQDG
jgi:hypothetical protein